MILYNLGIMEGYINPFTRKSNSAISMQKNAGIEGGIKESPSTLSSKITSLFNFIPVLISPFLFPLMVFLWPFCSYVEMGDWKFIRNYPYYLKGGFGYLAQIFRRRVFWRTTKRIFRNSLLSKEHMEKRITERKGKCVRCGRCCTILRCPLLEWDPKNRQFSCACYGNAFFLRQCAKYPMSQEEVDEYGCPGFQFED